MKTAIISTIAAATFMLTGCAPTAAKATKATQQVDLCTAIENTLSSENFTVDINAERAIKLERSGSLARYTVDGESGIIQLGTGYIYRKTDDGYELHHSVPLSQIGDYVAKDAKHRRHECNDRFLRGMLGWKGVEIETDEEGRITHASYKTFSADFDYNAPNVSLPINFSYSNDKPLKEFHLMLTENETILPLNFAGFDVSVVRFFIDDDLSTNEKNAVLSSLSYVAPVFKIKQCCREKFAFGARDKVTVKALVHYKDREGNKFTDEIHIVLHNPKSLMRSMRHK